MHDTCKKVGKVPWPPCLQRNRKARRAAGGSIKRYANKRRLCVILVRGIRATARIIAHLLSPLSPRSNNWKLVDGSTSEVRCDICCCFYWCYNSFCATWLISFCDQSRDTATDQVERRRQKRRSNSNFLAPINRIDSL